MLSEIFLIILTISAFGAAIYFYFQSKKEKEVKPTQVSEAKEIIVEAKDEAFKIKQDAETEASKIRGEVLKIEQRLNQKEENLDKKLEQINVKEELVTKMQRGVSKKFENLEQTRQQLAQKLEKAASITRDEAKKLIMDAVEKNLEKEIIKKIKEAEEKAHEEAEQKARDILIGAIQGAGTDYVAEYTTSRVKLSDEEMKGRIIGREGRNIKVLQQETGVDFDLDETPNEVRISSFDGIRREIARLALERLVTDGRIQPARIEEFVKKAKQDVEKEILKAGEKLAYDTGVGRLSKELLQLLGRFKFRTSYGQNLISHTLEVVNIAKLIATELGLDVDLVKKAALFHDLGKVQTAEKEGPHAQLTREILEKFHFDEKLINAAAAHHEEEEFKSPEAVIIHIADALSGARPGARFEDFEAFVKRMKALEDAALSFPGVERAYALSAGREVRVIVEPEETDDDSITRLSHDLAQKIEKEMTYPGTVKVTVIRETRASEIAK